MSDRMRHSADLPPIDRYPHAVGAVRTAAAREGDPRRAGRVAEHAVNLLDAGGLLLAPREPTSDREGLAVAAVVDAWPDLAADPVYVEQLVRVALNAAYNPAWRRPAETPAEPPAHPVTPAVPRQAGSGHDRPPAGGVQDIPDEALDVFEDAEAKCTFTHGGDYRRCCNRAGLRAAYPYLVAPALRRAEGELAEARAALAQAEVERRWLLAEADDDTRARFFAARRAEAADKIAAGSSSGTGTPPKGQDHG